MIKRAGRVLQWLPLILLASLSGVALAQEAPAPAAPAPAAGAMPFSPEPDTYERPPERIFPLFKKQLIKDTKRELPPPFGVMAITNWMKSDWEFLSAQVTLNGSNPLTLDAAEDATMDLNIQTNGIKADLWVFPFLNLFVGGGNVDADVNLGLRNVPLYFDPGNALPPNQHDAGFVYGDKIVPMEFNGEYYSVGTVLAGAWRRLYMAMDASWVKTELSGDASLSADGFWTFTAAPKLGYNAGMSQIYMGARFISKNEHYFGTVPLASGDTMGFDVRVKTDSWVGNAGLRTVIRNHWEILMEAAMGVRYQITAGVGYRW